MNNSPAIYLRCLWGILWREGLRFVHQRERFVSALVRPLVWLVVFAAGFRATLGVSIVPPYETYITYETYIVPGLIGMVLIFNAMQTSLSLVYDREMGSMRVLLTSPLPRWFLLLSKLIGGAAVSILQVYAFLLAAWLFGIELPLAGYVVLLPVLLLASMMLGAFLMVLSSTIRQMENFAGVMNFVIFPMFFMSSALYPLWRIEEANTLLHRICTLNPFTHAVELIRFTLYLKWNTEAAVWTVASMAVFLVIAIVAYDPKRGMVHRRGGA